VGSVHVLLKFLQAKLSANSAPTFFTAASSLPSSGPSPLRPVPGPPLGLSLFFAFVGARHSVPGTPAILYIAGLAEGVAMELSFGPLKRLLGKRSIPGWILFFGVFLWRRISDWQSIEWLLAHLFRKTGPMTEHPNMITIALFVASLIENGVAE